MARPRTDRSDLGNTVKFFAKPQQERLRNLIQFRDLIRQPEVQEAAIKDDRLFHTILRLAFESYGIQQSKVREALSLSDGVLGRWSRSTNLPMGPMRPVVIQALLAEIDPSIATQQQSDDLPLGVVH